MSAGSSNSSLKTLLRLIGSLRPYPLQTLLALATFALAGVIVVVLGQGVRRLLDVGLHGTLASLNMATLALILLVFVYGLTGLARAYLSGFITERITADLREQLMTNLLAHGLGFFEEQGSGLLWSRVMSDVGMIASMLAALVSAARSVVILLGGTWAMWATSASLTLAVLGLAVVMVGSVLWMSRSIRGLSDQLQDLLSRSNTFALETLDGIGVVKAFGQEQNSARRFTALAEGVFKKADRRNFAHGVTVGVSIWMIFGSAVLLAWIAGREMILGQLSGGRASAFLFYAVVVAMSGAALSDLWAQLQKGVGSAQRLYALIDQTPAIRSPSRPRRLSSPDRGEVRYDGVTFHYPMRPDIAALDNFSWTFSPGATTAIVGPSGAGKSTLLQLLLRLYDPTAGSILVDGIDLKSLDLDQLRSRISLVPQDPTLFDATLRENIRFGRADASDREVIAAAEAANVLPFVETLPQGLSTAVGPRGTQLSGGQRQRIAIARAILRDPRILLLDEATNALDAGSEALIQESLSAFSPGRTTLVIAHKLATVRSAHSIIVLDRGRLVSQGTHAELLAEEGLYAKFAALQLH